MSKNKKVTKKVVPVSIPCQSFEDVIADVVGKANAEYAKYEALTPKRQKAYLAKKAKEELEIQQILSKLGPNGPVRIQF